MKSEADKKGYGRSYGYPKPEAELKGRNTPISKAGHKALKNSWVIIRTINNDDRVIGVFENRKYAVKYLKQMLKQTLKDFDKQDKNNEYDYPFTINKIRMLPIEYREAYLGL